MHGGFACCWWAGWWSWVIDLRRLGGVGERRVSRREAVERKTIKEKQ